MGRTCRRRTQALAVCEPTIYIQDKQVTKRVVSLIRQTTDILRGKVKRAVDNLVIAITRRYKKVQKNVCFDLWSHLQENPATGDNCWSSFPVTTTIPEKIFCGQIDVHMCYDGQRRTEKAPMPATAKLERRKERLFADLYEKEF